MTNLSSIQAEEDIFCLNASFCWNNKSQCRLGYTLHDTTRMAMALLQEKIKQHDVAVGQFPILVHLWEKQGFTQKLLRELIRVEHPTLANTLKRMERDGLIKRINQMNKKININMNKCDGDRY